MQLNSESVLKGAERAPNRSLFYALGYTDEEINRPLIGVVSAYSEIVPGHAHLDKLAEAVKAGVRMAGGTPILVPSIGVCDGIAMGHIGMKYSLPSRELICDSVETMARAHGFDGLVLVPNCDKIVPGMLMAAARLNIPSIVVSGGPMLSGRQGTRHVSLSQMFEAVGSYKAGIIGEDVLDDYTKNTCPGCGSCSGMYTANSMNCLCEAIGMALPGNGTIPAVYAARTQLAKHAGMRIMDLVRDGVRPRDILTPAAFRNALATDMALGCSSNSVLHLLAIANEADVPMSLETFNEMSAKVPNFCHLAPAGPTHIEDLYAAGGVPAVMAQLAGLGLLDTSLPTVTGKTVGENIAGAQNRDTNAIRPADDPYSKTGGIAGQADDCQIADCYNTGDLVLPWGAGDNNGGIAGLTYNATLITRCYNTGTVTVEGSQAGGICGQLNAGATISSCYNAGKVGAKWNSGGIAGQSTDAEIIACHNDGLIESQTSGWAGAGGICGFHKGTITACYHIGQVTGDSAIGAIVGEHNSGNISYCYWNGDLEGIPAGGGGSQTGNAKFGAAWPQPSTHEAWRTTADTPAAYWRTLGSAGGGYPKLAWEK
mgnify:CR=1 FL=1